MTENITRNSVVTYLIENWNKAVTSADLLKLNDVETLVQTFTIMHELVNSKAVTQTPEDKYGKRVIVWRLVNGQESAFDLWKWFILPTLESNE